MPGGTISVKSFDHLIALKVYVHRHEKEKIEKFADECNVTTSTYLKLLGLGYEPKSILDHKSVLNLLKINGDQSQLGGLLKLLLSPTGNHLHGKEHRKEINQLINDIQHVQKQIMVQIKEIRLKVGIHDE